MTPAPPPASRSTVTEAETASFAAAGVTELVGVGGNKAGTLMPRPQPPLEQQQQQPLVEEESTMELYSQLIRRRCCSLLHRKAGTTPLCNPQLHCWHVHLGH